MSVLLPGDFSSSVLQQSKWSSGCYGSYTWFVSLFCVENYGIEAASCLAFSWVFQHEILIMEIGWRWSYGTARKTNDYAMKIHFMWLESTIFVSIGCRVVHGLGVSVLSITIPDSAESWYWVQKVKLHVIAYIYH